VRKLLALDTTSDFGSIALMEGSTLLEQVALHSSDGFAHILFQEIESLLARHGMKISDVDAFASASGPGSFTGVRIGLTAVKGLAEALGRKVVAISNLEALAWFGTKPLRAPVIDARRGEVYGAVYNSAGALVCREIVSKLPAWLESLPGEDLEIITQGFDIGVTRWPVVTAPRELAHAVGAIAVDRVALGMDQNPSAVDANYVRRSDAELFWKDSAG
jgi:tRNA threonylcarbamoyladenosine biosynthesis protein TsaB